MALPCECHVRTQLVLFKGELKIRSCFPPAFNEKLKILQQKRKKQFTEQSAFFPQEKRPPFTREFIEYSVHKKNSSFPSCSQNGDPLPFQFPPFKNFWSRNERKKKERMKRILLFARLYFEIWKILFKITKYSSYFCCCSCCYTSSV